MSQTQLLFSNGTSTAIHEGGNTNVIVNLPVLGKGKFYFEFTPSERTLYALVLMRNAKQTNHNSDQSYPRLQKGFYTMDYGGIIRFILETKHNIQDNKLTDYTLYFAHGATDFSIMDVSGYQFSQLNGVDANDYRIGAGVADSSSPVGIEFYFNFGSDPFAYELPEGCKALNEGLLLQQDQRLYIKENAIYGMQNNA